MNTLRLYWLLFVVVLFKTNIILIYCLCEPKRKEFGPAFIDRILFGPFLKKAVVHSEIACQYQCHFNDHCFMYNYNIKSSRCELLDGRSTNFKIAYKRTWLFKTLKCEKNPCKNNGVCYMNREVKCLCQCSWSGDFCDAPITDNRDTYMVTFPRKSVEDFLILDTPFSPNVDKFTLSLWAQIDPGSSPPHSIVSYATNSQNNDILVYITSGGIIFYFGGGSFSFNEPVVDGQWYHICFSWRSIDGQLKLYINGIKKGETVAKVGYIVQSGGALVIGQDQDYVKGGYQSYQAFQGSVTSINMWARVFTQAEISDMGLSCPNEDGSLVKWDDLKGTRTGALEENCSFSFCHP